MRLSLVFAAGACVLGFTAAPALAQVTAQAAQTAPAKKKDTRIPIVVFDARGVFARLGQDVTTAAGLATSALNLPASGRGVAGGAHLYLWRGRSMALGVGGEAAIAHAHATVTDSKGKPTGTVLDRRLRSFSGNVSLNFGHRDGWSYLTAGMGPTSFESYRAGVVPDGLRPTSLNFGGGARWFNWPHVAFTADMRFYVTKPADRTANTAQRARKSVVLFSGGIAIK